MLVVFFYFYCLPVATFYLVRYCHRYTLQIFLDDDDDAMSFAYDEMTRLLAVVQCILVQLG